MTFPRMSRAMAAANSLRAAPRAPLSVADGRYRLGLAAAENAPAGAQRMQVVFNWGEHRLRLLASQEVVGRVLASLDPDLAAGALPPDLLGLLIEAALLAGVTDLEQWSGQSVRIVAVTDADEPAEGERLFFAFDDGTRRWLIELVGGNDALLSLLRAWPLAPRAWSNLPIPGALRLGTTHLPLAVLRSLASEDIVLLQTLSPRGAVLVLADARLAVAENQSGVWRLAEIPRPARSADDKEWIMQRDDDVITKDDQPGGLDDIPVQLAFDLGRVEMSFGEVRRLGVGAVLETSRSFDGLVRISANGRLIGHGTLVDVDGRVGVEIVRLFDNG